MEIDGRAIHESCTDAAPATREEQATWLAKLLTGGDMAGYIDHVRTEIQIKKGGNKKCG